MSSITSLSPLAQFGILIAGVFAVIGILMEIMAASFHWRFVAKHRVREELPRKVDAAEHRRASLVNSLLSTSMFLFATLVFFDWLLYAGAASTGRVGFEIASMLLLYDFLYYLLHRYVFHEWEVGQKWHRVHHRIRSPRAKDSLFIHPMETFLGVATMIVSIVATGLLSGYLFAGSSGMHIVAFGIGFFVYSVLNVFIHSAIRLPMFPLNALSRNHDLHHASMRGGYYASITPIWDVIFRTNVATVPSRRSKQPTSSTRSP